MARTRGRHGEEMKVRTREGSRAKVERRIRKFSARELSKEERKENRDHKKDLCPNAIMGRAQNIKAGGAIRAQLKTGGGIQARRKIEAGEAIRAQRNRAGSFGTDANQ